MFIYPEVTEEPLMPSHLVIGRRLNTLPPPNYNKRCDTLADTEHFRKQWTKEYLIGLREFHHCGTQGDHDRKIKTRDVV